MVGVGLRKYSEEIGLKVIDGSVCGNYKGFFVRMDDLAGFKRIEIKLNPLNEEQLIKLDNFINTNKAQYRISSYSVLPTGVLFYINDTVGTMKVIQAFLPAVIENLISCEAEPLAVCGVCNERVDRPVSFYLKGDTTIIGHKECLDKPVEKSVEEKIDEITKSYGLGYLGAFLGMVVGIIPWVLISLAGFVAAIGGLILSIAVKFGYEKLGGKVGKPKIVALIVFSVVGVILATVASWTIGVYNEWNAAGEALTLLDALFGVIYFAISPEGIVPVASDIGLGLLFAALGSFRFISQEYKDIKTKTIQPITYTID